MAGHSLADGLPKSRMTETVTSGSVRGAYSPIRLKWPLLDRLLTRPGIMDSHPTQLTLD